MPATSPVRMSVDGDFFVAGWLRCAKSRQDGVAEGEGGAAGRVELATWWVSAMEKL